MEEQQYTPIDTEYGNYYNLDDDINEQCSLYDGVSLADIPNCIDYKRLADTLANDGTRVIHAKHNLMIGKTCYLERMPHGKVLLRKRLINWNEVSKLPRLDQNLIVSLVGSLNSDNFIADKHKRFTMSKIATYNRWLSKNVPYHMKNLIDLGYVLAVNSGSNTYYKLTDKCILPANPSLLWQVKDNG
jgi:hypothetical protein